MKAAVDPSAKTPASLSRYSTPESARKVPIAPKKPAQDGSSQAV